MSSWLTLDLALDDHTRRVLGLHLSLDAPSATAAALAVAKAVLPKADWPSAHDINLVWPMHGPPQVVQTIAGTMPVLRSRVFSERPEAVLLAIKGIFTQLVRGQQQSCDLGTHDTAPRDPLPSTCVGSGNMDSRTQRK